MAIYLIRRAEQYQPVIQLRAGTLATVVFIAGARPPVPTHRGDDVMDMRAVLRRPLARALGKIERLGGFVFYVGVRKTAAPGARSPNRLYARVFLEAIKRIDGHCAEDGGPPVSRSCWQRGEFVLILDEHEQRSAFLTEAAKSMYARRQRRRHLIEPPFHLESHRYQTIQATDWIAGLVGRPGAVWADPGA